VNAPAALTLPRAERIAFRDPTIEPPPALTVARYRMTVIMLMFILVTAVIGLRLVQLCLFADRGDGGAVAALPPRGEIFDRRGIPLGVTIRVWSIALNPQAVLGDKKVLAAELSELMPERSEADYRAMLFSKRKFIWLRQPALPSLVERIHALGEPGLLLLREPRRLYPQAQLGGHLLGYAQVGDKGLTGIGVERSLDADLKQGKDITLAVDIRVQAALEGEIARRMAETSAVGGAGIVMDVDTGEVVALSSLPSFNPNNPGKSILNMADKATLFTYEPGSTFKMLTFANAIESGVITDWGQTYNVSAPIRVGGHVIHDDEPKHRPLTIPEVMTFSSNIGTAQIADQIGPDRVQSFFRKFGFMEPVDIELRERGSPQLPPHWDHSAVMTTAFGQGINVTALHLAEAFAALANGGMWHPATLLRRDPAKPVPGRRLVSEATSAKMRGLMRLVVLQGTGTNADAPGLRVGGKTGTAEKIVNGRYVKHANVTTFAGAFPMDHPRYVVVVMLDDAKASKGTYGFKTAGWMTAPLAKRVIARIGPLLGVQPDLHKDIDVSDLMPFLAEKKVPGKNAFE
jgi:cell division protein FtsI (penicillin-binding protein 3)